MSKDRAAGGSTARLRVLFRRAFVQVGMGILMDDLRGEVIDVKIHIRARSYMT